jgi:RHS repeat-associated protein
MVNDMDIIHMNGRTYNVVLGRFMQADPHIQAPMNSQNYNRYSYVLNNPMSYTDPSGYFFKAIGKFVKKHWKTIVQIGISVMTAGAGLAWAMAGGALSGYVMTGSLRGALIGAFSGALFYGAGDIIANKGISNILAKGAIRGITGGITSVLSGGKFGHGFAAAGSTSMAGGQIGQAFKDVGAIVVASAVVGGTVSKLTGGKFGNGAVTAAFMSAYNEANHPTGRKSAKFDSPLGDWFRSIGDGVAAIRGSIEGTISRIGEYFDNSHAGGTLGYGYHLVIAGYSSTHYGAVDGTGNMCYVQVECVKFGPGVLINAGPGVEVNLANTPQLQEGNTEVSVGGFVEGGTGVIGSGSLDIGTQNLMPSLALGFKGLGMGAAAGIQVCQVEVIACN